MSFAPTFECCKDQDFKIMLINACLKCVKIRLIKNEYGYLTFYQKAGPKRHRMARSFT